MIKPPGYFQFKVLIAFIFIVMIGILGTAWYTGLGQKTMFLYVVIYAILVLLTAAFITLLLGIIGFYVFLKKGQLPTFFRKPTIILLNTIIPLLFFLGRIFGVPENVLQANVIYWLNLVNGSNFTAVKPADLLVLVPHCLQNNECKYHVVHNINNCHRCGKCKIQDLLALREENNFKIQVVTGGTLARQIVKKNKPKAIIAIACERDLLSGMVDIFPCPVWGIVNKRPNGPCFNTSVEINEVKEALNKLLVE